MTEEIINGEDELKSIAMNRTALRRGNWKPNELMKLRFDEKVKDSEFDSEDYSKDVEDEAEQKLSIVESFFPGESESGEDLKQDESKWKLLSAVQDPTTHFAPYSEDFLSRTSTAYFDCTSDDANSDESAGAVENVENHDWERNAPMGFTKKLEQYKAKYSNRKSETRGKLVHFYDMETTADQVPESPVTPTEFKDVEFFRKGTIEDAKHATGRIIEKPMNANGKKPKPLPD